MDNIKIYLEKLKNNYGINFSRDLINKFAAVTSEITLKKNDVLIRAGDKSSYIFFVVSGILRDYYIDDDGNDVTRFFSYEGGICGGEALISNEPSAVCTEALDDCVLLRCPVCGFKEIIAGSSEAAKAYIWLLESSLVYKIHRENSFLIKSAAERYVDFKRENPDLEKRVNQKYIASYLGITPVSLSRIRRALKPAICCHPPSRGCEL